MIIQAALCRICRAAVIGSTPAVVQIYQKQFQEKQPLHLLHTKHIQGNKIYILL